MNINNTIWEIIAGRIHREKLSEEEELLWKEWLEESPGNRELYKQLEELYSTWSDIELSHLPDVRNAWEKHNARRKQIQRKRKIGLISSAAAVVLLVCSMVFLFYRFSERQFIPLESSIVSGNPKAILTVASGERYSLEGDAGIQLTQEGGFVLNGQDTLTCLTAFSVRDTTYHLLEIPRGGEYKLTLDDSTQVWLNSETRLKFPAQFNGEKRQVFLEGEAYFEVVHNPERPFVVHTPHQEIVVLGTAFNVCTHHDHEQVYTTTLVNGSIRLATDNGETHTLEPQEQLVFRVEEGTTSVSKVNTTLYTSWKDGYYTFEEQSLEKIMYTLARWYDFQVSFEQSEVRNIRFSGRVRRYEDITNILELIEMTQDVKFNIKEKYITIHHK